MWGPLPALVSALSTVWSFIFDVNSGSLTKYLAGDAVTVEMHQQPGDRSCANEAIGGDHYGPINVRDPFFRAPRSS